MTGQVENHRKKMKKSEQRYMFKSITISFRFSAELMATEPRSVHCHIPFGHRRMTESDKMQAQKELRSVRFFGNRTEAFLSAFVCDNCETIRDGRKLRIDFHNLQR